MRTLPRTVAAVLFAAALPAAADKADREKEINIGADKLLADDNARTSVFDGNVIVTQGTMRITAAKVTVKEDPERFKFYVATGSPVTFRQRRDKADDYIEGWAARAEFDDKTAKLKLFDKARLKSVQGEITGDVITYDTNRELFEVSGGPQSGMPSSRVKATLIPQKKAGDAKGDAKSEPKAAPPLGLKTDTNPPGTN
jgi:lipopolysaccharide export system protein LptA